MGHWKGQPFEKRIEDEKGGKMISIKSQQPKHVHTGPVRGLFNNKLPPRHGPFLPSPLYSFGDRKCWLNAPTPFFNEETGWTLQVVWNAHNTYRLHSSEPSWGPFIFHHLSPVSCVVCVTRKRWRDHCRRGIYSHTRDVASSPSLFIHPPSKIYCAQRSRLRTYCLNQTERKKGRKTDTFFHSHRLFSSWHFSI